MAINFNTGPYYDDFDKDKNFYKVLYKPGYAVQARELNQMQSIQQHQLAGISNHVFKKNSMVIPGGIVLNNNADIVFVSSSSTITDFSTLVGKTITNAVAFDATDDTTLDGFITAVVLGYREAIAADNITGTEYIPACLYVKYFKGQTEAPYRTTFDTSEALKTVEITPIEFNTDADFASRKGKVAVLSAGVFYTNEYFVDVQNQSVIVDHDSLQSTNALVVLRIEESIVTSDDDESLLDNANGAPNQYAPGADRYKINLVLAVINDINFSSFDSDRFILMMTIENNIVTYINDRTEYAELMKTLARRTYDANGNFIVSGLNPIIGINPDDNYLTASVSSGKGYIGGFEYNQIANTDLPILKPRDEDHTESFTDVTSFTTGLAYFYVAGGGLLKELPAENTLVQLLDATPDTASVSVIGYGVYRGIQFETGGINTDEIYKAYFDWVYLEEGHTTKDIGGFKVIAAAQGAPVLHELSIINLTGTIAVGDVVADTIDNTIAGTVFHVSNAKTLYVLKDTLNPVPSGDTIKSDAVTPVFANVASYFISNYSDEYVPMIQVDQDVIKTLYNGDGDNTTTYSFIRKDEIAITPTNKSDTITLGANETFEDFSTSDFMAYVVEDEEFISGLNSLITFSSTSQIVFDVTGSGYDGETKTILLYSTVNKVNVAEATKTNTTVTTQIVTPSKSYMALDNQDVIEIVKVVDGGAEAVTFTDTGDTVNLTGHGLVNTNQVMFSSITSTTGISTYTRYYVVNKTDDTFQLSLTSGGSAITLTTNGTGTLCRPADINNSVDITSRFTLLSGNTASYTGTGLIKLRNKATPPVGQIAVRYKYYAVSSGNYISVDSYGDYTGDLTYIGQIADVKTDKGETVNPRTYLDFRTRTSKYFFKNYGTVAASPSVTFQDTEDTVTLNNHGFANGTAVRFSSITTTTGISINTTYYVVGAATNTFQVADTIGGSAKALTTNGTGKIAPVLKVKDLNLSSVASSLVGKYIVGPGFDDSAIIGSVAFNATTGNTEITLNSTAATSYSGTYYIGLNGSGLSLVDTDAGGKEFTFPKDGAPLSYSYTRFTAKHTLIYIDRNSSDSTSLKQIELNNLSEADALRRNAYKLPIMYVYMEPYTLSLRNISFKKYENPTYQMLDIHNIKERVDRNEYYTLLALAGGDIDAINTSIGLENSGFGFWVENFLNPGTQEYTSPDYKATIYDKSYVGPGVTTKVINLELDTTVDPSTWQQTDTSLTLPYTEVLALTNTAATLGENLNPFNNIDWTATGKLTLIPSVDNWVETEIAPIPVVVPPTVDPVPPTPTPVIDPPQPERPPVVIPEPVLDEVVVEVTNIRAQWGPDSRGGKHSITFDWKTNTGRKGRVNTDKHLSPVVNGGKLGLDKKDPLGFQGPPNGHKEATALSMINKKYNDPGVKEYLNGGTHFDQHPPEWWRKNKPPKISINDNV